MYFIKLNPPLLYHKDITPATLPHLLPVDRKRLITLIDVAVPIPSFATSFAFFRSISAAFALVHSYIHGARIAWFHFHIAVLDQLRLQLELPFLLFFPVEAESSDRKDLTCNFHFSRFLEELRNSSRVSACRLKEEFSDSTLAFKPHITNIMSVQKTCYQWYAKRRFPLI